MATSDSLSGGLLLFSDEMNSLALAFFPVRPQLASEGAARRMATFPHLFAELSDRVWGGGEDPGGGGWGPPPHSTQQEVPPGPALRHQSGRFLNHISSYPKFPFPSSCLGAHLGLSLPSV